MSMMDESTHALRNIQPGDPIAAAHIRSFGGLLAARRIIPGAGARISTIPGHGTMVEAEEQELIWDHPWLSYLSGSAAIVRAGAVNTLVPWLDGRALDGTDKDGKPHSKGVPQLALSAEVFTPEGYSWGVVRVKVDKSTGRILKPEDGGLTIAQTATATWIDGGSVDADGSGDHPIFQLRRLADDTKSLGTLSQLSFFNIQHRFVAGGLGAAGRHFFWA